METKVIGIGGIGTCLLPPLARYLTYTQPDVHLQLIDGDNFTPDNRDRQSFTALGNKAEVKAAELKEQFPSLCLDYRAEYVTSDNIILLIREGDYILLCVDNHATRKLVSDHCEELANVVLISGGNELTDGSVHVFIRRDGVSLTLPLANDFHLEIQYPKDASPADQGCDQVVESKPQLLFTNNLIAATMLGSLFNAIAGEVTYDEIYCDLMSGNSRAVARSERSSLSTQRS